MKTFRLIMLMLLMTLVLSIFAEAANKYVNMTLVYDYSKHSYSAEEVFVEVDGKKLERLSMPPIIWNNYTLVPAREVFEAMGASVDWKKDTEQSYIKYDKNLVVISIGSKKAYVNGVSKSMSIPAKIINNKTMIPLRFVSDGLGFKTEWDSKTRIANIVTLSEEATEIQTDTDEWTSEETTVQTTADETEATTIETTTVETTTAATSAEEPETEYTTLNSPENMYYDYENEALYIKRGNIQLSDIAENDDYLNHQYTVEIKGNLRNTIVSENYITNGEYIQGCNVDAGSSKTTILFTENRIAAMDISYSGNYVCIRAVSPKEKYNKIVIVDPGHGGDPNQGGDPGAGANGLEEKDLTLGMALSVKEKLDADGSVKCYMTRLGDTYIGLKERAAIANDIGGDIFISIHINSAKSTEAHGTETYALYPNDLGNGLISYTVAEEMLNQLLEKLGTKNRNIKSNTYVVLKENKIPATLLEIGFISNAEEAEMMSNSIDKVGEAVYDGIINLFKKYPTVR